MHPSLAAITSVSGQTVTVDSLGPDDNLGFQANQWVEICDDTYLFGEVAEPAGPALSNSKRRSHRSLDHAHRARRPVDTYPQCPPAPLGSDRWFSEQLRGAAAAGTSIALENGIQVSFSAGTYQSGDYWTIPARAASGTIEWPPCGGGDQLFQPPRSITVYNAPLACIHWNATTQQAVVEDCRRFFSPLTELTTPAASKALHVTG